MSKYDVYYKDMSADGLKKLKKYGFKKEVSEYDGTIYDIHYEHGGLWLDVEYIPEAMNSDELEMDKRVIGNGELGLDSDWFHDFGNTTDIEILCKLYKDDLIEFKEMPGTAYEMQYGGAK